MSRYLITGATRGIGRVLVEQLAPEHDLIVVGRSAEALAELPARARIVADLSMPAELATAAPALGRLGHLDAVVHCAGMALRADLADSTVADWQDHLTLNVVAVAELTRLLLPALRAAGGAVVLVNSGQGRSASANSSVYAASKFALRGLADSLRAEEPDLRVTSVYPGRVATDMQRTLREQEGGAYEPERYLRPETVAGVIAQILSTPADAVITEVTLRPAHP
jgi:NADP-dependent 3-hydroxy acid dehydrogenase YdfG